MIYNTSIQWKLKGNKEVLKIEYLKELSNPTLK